MAEQISNDDLYLGSWVYAARSAYIPLYRREVADKPNNVSFFMKSYFIN